MRRPTAGLRSARCRESVRNGRGSRGSGPASRRNPRCERPARARSGACATAAYSTDWPKRAFELPIPCSEKPEGDRPGHLSVASRTIRSIARSAGARFHPRSFLACQGWPLYAVSPVCEQYSSSGARFEPPLCLPGSAGLCAGSRSRFMDLPGHIERRDPRPGRPVRPPFDIHGTPLTLPRGTGDDAGTGCRGGRGLFGHVRTERPDPSA